MKKSLLSILSLLVYVLLFLALIYVVMYDISFSTSNQKSPSVTPKKVLETLENYVYPTSSTKYDKLSKKEENLSEVDFSERLKVLDAKVGDAVFIRIFKKESFLEVWIKPQYEYVLFKRYPICAYSGYLGPKLKEGDRQSPEGFYRVNKGLLNPKSKYHLAFNLGYPNAYDRSHKRTGSYLMVHGECVSIGCYAMTNVKIEEIYKLVEEALNKGQKYVQVHAFPFLMTGENMAEYQDNKWYDFWTELKVGYDYFEAEKLPPLMNVKNGHYTIHEANE